MKKKNTTIDGDTDTKNGRNDELDISTEDLIDLDNTDTSKIHESIPVSDKDRTTIAPIYSEFSEMGPKLFSHVVKNNSGNKEK
jgi:hypothetical protein